jgi:hypothetical protein
VAGSYEHGNEYSVSIKVGISLAIINYELFKNDPVPWN